MASICVFHLKLQFYLVGGKIQFYPAGGDVCTQVNAGNGHMGVVVLPTDFTTATGNESPPSYTDYKSV